MRWPTWRRLKTAAAHASDNSAFHTISPKELHMLRANQEASSKLLTYHRLLCSYIHVVRPGGIGLIRFFSTTSTTAMLGTECP